MPIPQPHKGEKQDEFIARCMADDVMNHEYPDEKQRAAVCYAQWKDAAQAEAPISFVSEPGGLCIEAAAEVAGDAPKLPRFTMVAYCGGAMRLAGWRYPVVVDLAGLVIPSQSRPIRFAHDIASGVGHTDSIAVKDGRLIAAGVVSRDTAAAREVVVSARNGFPWQASIGAQVEQFEFVKENQTVIVNGREFVGPVNVVRKAILGEISFVDAGADAATSAQLAASAQLEDKAMSEQKTEVVKVDVAAPPVEAAVDSAAIDAEIARIQRERAIDDMAVEAIRKSDKSRDTVEKIRELAAAAKISGQSLRDFELELLRAGRPVPHPAVHAGDTSISNAVLEAACMLTARYDGVEKLFSEQTLDAAHKRFRGGISLQQLLLEAAWAHGYVGRNSRDLRGMLTAAFGRDVQAGFSSVDIGGILSNVANKFLLDGFFAVERTWRNICSVRNVADFKTVTSYRLIGADQYEPVAPGGELKHGTLGEEKYTNKADTFGIMLTIDRRDIINDDLGAITTVPRKLGRGAGLKVNDVFWATFLNNSSFFTEARNNYLDGANTALGIDGLTAAEVAFLDQVDSDGKPTGIMPAILLVPTALSAIGTQLYKSVEMRDTSASTKYPVANPHQGKFRVEVSRYLSNSHYTGHSAKAWYLLADPADLPVIEVAFLNGQESPTIETAEADFHVLGIQMRGYHDFGVALQDYRGGVKVKGEA